MLLFEVALSTVALFAVFLRKSFLVTLVGALVLLDAFFYPTMLISPDLYGYVAVGFSLILTLLLILLDNGIIRGSNQCELKKNDEYSFDEHQQVGHMLTKIFSLASIIVHLYSHYQYCKLNMRFYIVKEQFENGNNNLSEIWEVSWNHDYPDITELSAFSF